MPSLMPGGAPKNSSDDEKASRIGPCEILISLAPPVLGLSRYRLRQKADFEKFVGFGAGDKVGFAKRTYRGDWLLDSARSPKKVGSNLECGHVFEDVG